GGSGYWTAARRSRASDPRSSTDDPGVGTARAGHVITNPDAGKVVSAKRTTRTRSGVQDAPWAPASFAMLVSSATVWTSAAGNDEQRSEEVILTSNPCTVFVPVLVGAMISVVPKSTMVHSGLRYVSGTELKPARSAHSLIALRASGEMRARR